MTCNPNPLEPTEATLLALHNNESENIEYTKKRTYWLMAAYSTVCGFLLSPSTDLNLTVRTLLFFPSLIFTLACCLAIGQNYCAIIKRRKKLKDLHEKLKSPFSVEPKCDCWIPVMQIAYLLTVYGVTLLRIFKIS